MRASSLISFLAFGIIALTACAPAAAADSPALAKALAAVSAAGYAPETAAAIKARINASPERFLSLLAGAEKDEAAVPDLFRRADKTVPLGDSYIPADLVALDGTGLSVSRKGHHLRRGAYEAMLRMNRAARADAVTLLISSSYRSYEYQKEVFARNTREEGSEAAAERISARPGYSQHQLGTVIDFGTIDNNYVNTKPGKWLAANAWRYGWSLSYPKGLENITGYDWECWHYRYIGISAAQLQREFFGDIQQYVIEFFEQYNK